VDREESARQIVAAARATRQPWPRWLWIFALSVAAVCAGALAIAWFTTDSEPSPSVSSTTESSRRFGAAEGLICLGAGITIGLAIGRRTR
jgi:hypothetical protein